MILSFPASNTVCGINRNIVECKVTVPFASGDARSVLIETLWNVKSYDATDKDITAFRINRNIVECKGSNCNGYMMIIVRINRNIVECKDR